jgi:hypothetical protein
METSHFLSKLARSAHFWLVVLSCSHAPALAQAPVHYFISTVAGTGEPGYNGDGIAATRAQLMQPSGIAVDAAGNLFIADGKNHRIRKVNRDGLITTIAGIGEPGSDGDGGPATKAKVGCPYNTRPADDGSVFIADVCSDRIRQVLPNGIIRTIAGGGGKDLGDGGPATKASLRHPDDMIADSAGNLYIADTVHHRIRKVDRSGIITTVAGTGALLESGESGYSGDGGPARKAMINFPDALALDKHGNLYFAELHNHIIRKVSPDGTISTVAGDGQPGYKGDGGRATKARLHTPTGVAVLANGTLLISDSDNYRLRAVLLDGRIETLAGLGKPGFTGDHGPAGRASLGVLDIVTADRNGEIYLADYGNNRIRKLSPQM